MLRRTRLCGGLILALTVFAGMAVAGQSTTPPNWAQVDRTTAWICPTPKRNHGGVVYHPRVPRVHHHDGRPGAAVDHAHVGRVRPP